MAQAFLNRITMERQLDIIAYLLARTIGKAEGRSVEDVLAEAAENTKPKRTPGAKLPAADPDAVERIYAIYPTKCPVRKQPTGKSAKDKDKIARLLATMSEQQLTQTITRYVDDCRKTGAYLKNFSTLLNNLPDYSEPEQQAPPKERIVPRSPERMALDAKANHATRQDARYAIAIVWDTIPESRIDAALDAAGF